MLDMKLIRKDPKSIEEKLKTKDPSISLSPILEMDEKIRAIKQSVEDLKARRNHASKEIGEKKRRSEDVAGTMQEVAGLGEQISKLDHDLSSLEERMKTALGSIPNIPMDDIPVSLDKKDNVCIKEFGEKPSFDFPFKNHVELNEPLHLFDFKRAAKTSGSGWPAYFGIGARLEWALLNYMIDTQMENGFTLWMPPLLVRPEIVFGSAHLPKFEDQLFKIKDDDYDLYLIPTAEAALNGLCISG